MKATDVDSIVKEADEKCLEVLRQISLADLSQDHILEEIEIDKYDIITVAREHPRRLAYYSGILAMVNSAIYRCDTALDILGGELYDYYSNEYSIELKQSEIKYFITHDSKHRRLLLMKNALVEQQEKLKSIVGAFEQRSYSINNVTKLALMEFERSKMET